MYLCILNTWTKGPGSAGLNICTGVFQQGPHQADSIKLVNDSVGRQRNGVRREFREEVGKKGERNEQGKNKQNRKSVHADLSSSAISCLKDLRAQLFSSCLFLSLSLAASVCAAAGSTRLLPSSRNDRFQHRLFIINGALAKSSVRKTGYFSLYPAVHIPHACSLIIPSLYCLRLSIELSAVCIYPIAQGHISIVFLSSGCCLFECFSLSLTLVHSYCCYAFPSTSPSLRCFYRFILISLSS